MRDIYQIQRFAQCRHRWTVYSSYLLQSLSKTFIELDVSINYASLICVIDEWLVRICRHANIKGICNSYAKRLVPPSGQAYFNALTMWCTHTNVRGSILPREVMGLTHWGRVTHICVSKLTIIGSDNGLSPGRLSCVCYQTRSELMPGRHRVNASNRIDDERGRMISRTPFVIQSCKRT